MGLVPALNDVVTGDPRVPGPLIENDEAIRDVVNGNIDADNLAANAVTTAKILDANVTDAKLASPNNSVYKTIFTASCLFGSDLAAATYLVSTKYDDTTRVATPIASGGTFQTTSPAIFPAGDIGIYFDDADYTVGSKTTKLRLRAQVSDNATAWSSVTATFGLYPVTFAGGADALTVTLGTVVSGSTVAIANPSASTTNQDNSGDFTIPSDGFYCIGVVTSATLTNNATSLLTAQLQTRNV